MAAELGGKFLLQLVQANAEKHDGDLAAYLSKKYASPEQKQTFAQAIDCLYDSFTIKVDPNKVSKKLQIVPLNQSVSFTLNIAQLSFDAESNVRGHMLWFWINVMFSKLMPKGPP